MIVYLVEFAILHLTFLLVYKFLLSKETQLRFLRSFLIGSTILSLTIPLVELPSAAAIPTINLEAIVFSGAEVSSSQVSESVAVPAYQWVLIMVSILFLIRLFYGLIRIAKWYKKSELDHSFEFPVRRVDGIENSFTFFKWIFIDPDHFENPNDIIKHEWGHSRQFHSLDRIFFNVLIIPFWWIPSIWMMIYELKKIHEYEADQFALRSTDQSNYIKTLVHSTLKAHGLNLASSFDDAPTVQRLNFMKKMKKKISPWKVGSIMAIVFISAAMFACQDQLDSEIQRIVEESNQQFDYTPEVQAALDEAKQKNPGVEFAVIETLLENEHSINKLKKYDPSQIEAMFVYKGGELHDKDGDYESEMSFGNEEGHDRVVLIVSESSELFEKTIELHKSQDEDNVFTIVEEAPTYPGGMEAYYQYIQAEMKYPEDARTNKVEGRAFIQFIVEKDGSLTNFEVLKSVSPSCDKEALRVLKNSTNWQPAKIDGESVRMKLVVPVNFTL